MTRGYLLSVGYPLGKEESNLYLEQEVTELGYSDTYVTVYEGCFLTVNPVYLCNIHACKRSL